MVDLDDLIGLAEKWMKENPEGSITLGIREKSGWDSTLLIGGFFPDMLELSALIAHEVIEKAKKVVEETEENK